MTSFRCTVALVVVMAAIVLQASAMPPMTTERVCVKPDSSPIEGDIGPGQVRSSSDGCTDCWCDENTLIVYCVSGSCPPRSCHDSVRKPGVCCDECPNGYNCKTPGGTLVSDGQYVIENNENCTCSSEYTGMPTGSEGPQTMCIPLPTPPPPGCSHFNGTVVVGTKPGDFIHPDPCTICLCNTLYKLWCCIEVCPRPECRDAFIPQGQCCPQCP
ncbi:hypothetical protein V1264_008939 [Littorina saxatilis]|uniref:VWFC domain-containing protein n=1 Tax=Littorina saxatilis TaxID=31220 RepID=A0AAN9AR71_9CAEN